MMGPNNPYLNLTDEKLMVLYQNDEYLAFDEIYRRHNGRVFTYLSKRLSDKESINDVFQNIFIKFHKTRHKYDQKFPLAQWLYTLSRNELLDFVKKMKPDLQIEDFSQNLSEDPQSYTREKEMNFPQLDLNQEKSLTQNEKKVLKLRYLEDQDFKVISNLLNTSQSNVRKIVSRGLTKLKLKYQRGSQ